MSLILACLIGIAVSISSSLGHNQGLEDAKKDKVEKIKDDSSQTKKDPDSIKE